MTSDYVSSSWSKYFGGQECEDFNKFWNMDLEPLDHANIGRKGWSRVFIWPLLTKSGELKKFVVKRQQNYNRLSWANPIRSRPTFEKEYFNIHRYRQHGIPTAKPVYFVQSKSIYGKRSILITEYLEDYQPLNEIVFKWSRDGLPGNTIRKLIIETVAFYIRKLHKAHLVHRHLQLKHIFIRLDNERVDIRFIDMEASQWQPFGFNVGFRDLVTLNRSARWVKATDRLRFIFAYFGIDRLDRRTKIICKIIMKRTEAKKHKHTVKYKRQREYALPGGANVHHSGP